MSVPLSPLSQHLRSLSDAQLSNAGHVLNDIQRRLGFRDATEVDVYRERGRRIKFRKASSKFGHDLIAIQAAMGLPDRTLTNAWWAVKNDYQLEELLPEIAQRAGVSDEILLAHYRLINPPKPPRARKKPDVKPPTLREAKAARRAEQSDGKKAETYSDETVMGVRQRFLGGMSVTEICNNQKDNPLPGTNGRILGHGLIRGYCTNERKSDVPWPVIGPVMQKFSGKKAEEKAAAYFRGRVADIRQQFSQAAQ